MEVADLEYGHGFFFCSASLSGMPAIDERLAHRIVILVRGADEAVDLIELAQHFFALGIARELDKDIFNLFRQALVEIAVDDEIVGWNRLGEGDGVNFFDVFGSFQIAHPRRVFAVRRVRVGGAGIDFAIEHRQHRGVVAAGVKHLLEIAHRVDAALLEHLARKHITGGR